MPRGFAPRWGRGYHHPRHGVFNAPPYHGGHHHGHGIPFNVGSVIQDVLGATFDVFGPDHGHSHGGGPYPSQVYPVPVQVAAPAPPVQLQFPVTPIPIPQPQVVPVPVFQPPTPVPVPVLPPVPIIEPFPSHQQAYVGYAPLIQGFPRPNFGPGLTLPTVAPQPIQSFVPPMVQPATGFVPPATTAWMSPLYPQGQGLVGRGRDPWPFNRSGNRTDFVPLNQGGSFAPAGTKNEPHVIDKESNTFIVGPYTSGHGPHEPPVEQQLLIPQIELTPALALLPQPQVAQLQRFLPPPPVIGLEQLRG